MVKKHCLTLIEWDDSAGGEAWEPIAEADLNPLKIRSVGWLIKENKNSLVLAAAWDGTNGLTASRQTILKRCITRRKSLRRG